MTVTTALQHADYTFKYNSNLGRHGWLRLTPAYSVKLVQRLIGNVASDELILDPFSGTATTGLVAAENGNRAISFDINPFLVWLGNIKCRNYRPAYLQWVRTQAETACAMAKDRFDDNNWRPSIYNIDRWWSKPTLKGLSALRACLVDMFGEPEQNLADGLAWVAFCRLVLETSSAVFNHISMSFNDEVAHYETAHITELYLCILDTILNSCELPLPGHAEILLLDARCIPNNGILFNRVITSPPYSNRISYIRELRPYMYWTRFLTDACDAGEMDWKAIGGTWGIATSRLNEWTPEIEVLSPVLLETATRIAHTESKNGKLLAIYVTKYFHDMHMHLASIRNVLAVGAHLNYIIGNSSFYGHVVNAPEIITSSMHILGYTNISYEVIRKRNCNKALYEYNISASWRP
jgi:hypothetical protein